MNKQDLSKNLKFFNVPEDIIPSIYSKLAMRVFDVYVNIHVYIQISTKSEKKNDRRRKINKIIR